MKHLSPEELQPILDLRRRRDHAALLIGIATHDWRRAVASAEQIIADAGEGERVYAERILRVKGLDPDAGDYRITEDGRILALSAGEYREVD